MPITIQQIKQIASEKKPTDYSAAYGTFNRYYSIDALSRLSEEDLVVRLFASAEYAKQHNGEMRGYAVWSEHGDGTTSGIVLGRGKGQNQTGVLLKPDGTFNLYIPETKNTSITQIEKTEAIRLAKIVLEAFSESVALSKKADLSDIKGYEALFDEISKMLRDLETLNLYWNKDGVPNGVFLKYLHCSLPNRFTTWYSNAELHNIVHELFPDYSNGESSFVLNGRLALAASECKIDQPEFIDIIAEQLSQDNESAFKKWLKKRTSSSGTAFAQTTINTYVSQMKKGYKNFAQSEFDYRNIFYVNDTANLDNVWDKIQQAKGYAEFVKKSGNDACAQGIKQYRVFIEETFGNSTHNSNPQSGKEHTMRNESIDKNIILYGPPGTGKTYSTVIYAVAIVENKSISKLKEEAAKDYNAVFERYKKYKDEGRIEFTTFHQSYGYEDFIEGIRPVMDDETDSDISYEISAGVFKEFCDKTISISGGEEFEQYLNSSPVVWKVSLAGTGNNPVREECLANNHIRIGWDDYGPDLQSDIADGKAILNAFYSKMRKGDIVFSCFTASTVDAIGVVTGDAAWDDSFDDYKRVRAVKWLVKGIHEDITDINGGKTMTLSTVYRLNNISVSDALSLVKKNSKENLKFVESDRNYVFIIDEINRGNISKIFGELLTLIEPNKRLGASEEASARLPYSKTLFGVPNNVYILGTMNTADRSIALLDTALRRRFSFKEIMPQPELLDDVVIDGLNVGTMLESMNRKIKALYDREHMIGHAYFMALKENKNKDLFFDIFTQKVFPLLQEYFYDDYKKIRAILGDSGFGKDESMQFIKIDNEAQLLFPGEDLAFDDDQYIINNEAFYNIEAYKSI